MVWFLLGVIIGWFSVAALGLMFLHYEGNNKVSDDEILKYAQDLYRKNRIMGTLLDDVASGIMDSEFLGEGKILEFPEEADLGDDR